MICEQCSLPIGREVIRGALTIRTDPWRLYWRGVRVMGLAPGEMHILAVLAQTGSASTIRLEMLCLREDTNPKALKVRMVQLRRRLRRLLPAVRITTTTDQVWGYMLEMEDDMTDIATTKVKLLDHIAGLPDDLAGAVLVYPDAKGKVAAFSPNAALPQVIEMLGLATGSIGRRMVPAVTGAAP